MCLIPDSTPSANAAYHVKVLALQIDGKEHTFNKKTPEDDTGDFEDKWKDEADLNESVTGVSKNDTPYNEDVYGVQKLIKSSVGARRAALSLLDGIKPLRLLVRPLRNAYVLEGCARRSRPHARHRAPQLPWA
jgi:hypothetical protein